MGVLMITVWYPPHKSTDIAKLYLKRPREIPNVSKWRVFNCPAGKEGMKQYHLIYTERGKLEEANEELAKYFLPFSQIKGVYMKFENLIGVQDSYKLIGMKWE
jgi:hypothetical protein